MPTLLETARQRVVLNCRGRLTRAGASWQEISTFPFFRSPPFFFLSQSQRSPHALTTHRSHAVDSSVRMAARHWDENQTAPIHTGDPEKGPASDRPGPVSRRRQVHPPSQTARVHPLLIGLVSTAAESWGPRCLCALGSLRGSAVGALQAHRSKSALLLVCGHQMQAISQQQRAVRELVQSRSYAVAGRAGSPLIPFGRPLSPASRLASRLVSPAVLSASR